MYWCVEFGYGEGGLTCYATKKDAMADYETALHQWKLGIRVNCPEFLGFVSLEEV